MKTKIKKQSKNKIYVFVTLNINITTNNLINFYFTKQIVFLF